MTEGQKDILIVKMLDAPDSLTDKELDMILHDKELRDIYETSAIISGASSSQKEFDAEQEWRLFRSKILPKPSLTRRFMRIAAIFLGVIVVGGIIGKIIDYTLSKEYEEQTAETAKSTKAKSHEIKEDTPKIPYVEPTSTPEQTKEAAPPKTAAQKKTIKAPQNEEAEEIDVDEYLRQQQEEIEDAIIRQRAEIYVDEYYAMKEFISGMNDENIIITE